MKMNDYLNMWTVYDHPRDVPDCFVARRWEIHKGGRTKATTDVVIGSSLDEVRARLPGGLHRMERYENDDPKIVEVWL